MSEIPDRVLSHFDLESTVPVTRLKQGMMCDTWIAGDLVIQHVSKQSYEHHLAVLERTAELRLTGKLTGVVFLLETVHDPDGSWWRAAPRLPGPSAMACGRNPLEVAEEIARPIGEELAALATLPSGGLPRPSMDQDLEPARILASLRRRGHGVLAEMLEAIPPEPATNRVLAHGDPVFKNILLTSRGPILIDWEFCQELPAGNDIAHFTAWLAYDADRGVDVDRLHAISREMAQGAGLELEDDELCSLIAWGVARDLAVGGARRYAEVLPRICRAYGLI